MKYTYVAVFALFVGLALAKPMESIERYNIILVHGAADSLSGMDCGASDLEEAYSYYDPTAKNEEDIFGRIESYYDISWDPSLNPFGDDGFDLTKMDTSRSNATGMLGAFDQDENDKLTFWLDSTVFEDYTYDEDGNPFIGKDENAVDSLLYSSQYLYIQRSFYNPAESPKVNGGEIGNRKWKGEGKCNKRRSLIEEAQEVRASFYDSVEREFIYGQNALDSLRKYPDLYRQLASRYILIGHSMGGVVSREYVQGNFYNGDVDKIITIFFGRTGDEIYG